MFNLFSARENARYLYSYIKLYKLMASMRICAEKDPRIKARIEKIEDGTTLYLTTFPAKHVIKCKKSNGVLNFSFERNVYLENEAYVMFKSIELAMPVLENYVSFTQAFNQSRLIIRGDTQIGMQFVDIFDISQATCASKHRRNKYLKARPYSEKIANDVKFLAFFRGWL